MLIVENFLKNVIIFFMFVLGLYKKIDKSNLYVYLFLFIILFVFCLNYNDIIYIIIVGKLKIEIYIMVIKICCFS